VLAIALLQGGFYAGAELRWHPRYCREVPDVTPPEAQACSRLSPRYRGNGRRRLLARLRTPSTGGHSTSAREDTHEGNPCKSPGLKAFSLRSLGPRGSNPSPPRPDPCKGGFWAAGTPSSETAPTRDLHGAIVDALAEPRTDSNVASADQPTVVRSHASTPIERGSATPSRPASRWRTASTTGAEASPRTASVVLRATMSATVSADSSPRAKST
jgi:hypothetical protein